MVKYTSFGFIPFSHIRHGFPGMSEELPAGSYTNVVEIFYLLLLCNLEKTRAELIKSSIDELVRGGEAR